MWRYHLCTHQHKRDDYKPPWNVLQAAGADIKYTSAVSDLTKATYKSWLHQYSLVSFLWAHQADLVILLQISLVLNIRAATIARKWPKFSDSSLLNVIICVTVNWRSLCCGQNKMLEDETLIDHQIKWQYQWSLVTVLIFILIAKVICASPFSHRSHMELVTATTSVLLL